jgi:23S rRNA pseudouridine1911/1915/1917 synthase
MKRWTVREKSDLKSFLSNELGVSRGKSKELIDSKSVFVNDKRVWIATHILRKGDVVEVDYDPNKEENISKIEIPVLYEDEYILAVDKPAGLVSDQEPNSVESRIRKFLKDDRIRAIHRLDRDTTGVLLYAKNDEVFERFKAIWEEREVKKTYVAISHHMPGAQGFLEKKYFSKIGGRSAVSDIKRLKTAKGYTYFRVEIETGRKHQIRIHLAALRYPIVGDKEYGLSVSSDPLLKQVKRQMLHAYQISFTCPMTQERRFIQAPVPADMKKLMKDLAME